jgi:hypothetical protein
MDTSVHGQPLQLEEVVHGSLHGRVPGAWSCPNKRARDPSIDNPTRGEKQGRCREAPRNDHGGKAGVHSSACPDLVAVSTYDTKPVHILSMTTECVRWDVKERLVWSTAIQKKAIMKYLRLNIIEEYNSHMNSTDVADQLRGNYRPDRWMRQRKWWWAFFVWSIGVAGVNAY